MRTLKLQLQRSGTQASSGKRCSAHVFAIAIGNGIVGSRIGDGKRKNTTGVIGNTYDNQRTDERWRHFPPFPLVQGQVLRRLGVRAQSMANTGKTQVIAC